jgi:hypothetical protein
MEDIQKAIQINELRREDNVDLIKGRVLPVGTIKDRGGNNFIKTANGWKYHSRANPSSRTPTSEEPKANKPTTNPTNSRQARADRVSRRQSGEVTMRDVLATTEGKAIVDSIEEHISDLKDDPTRKEHIDGLKEKVAELKEKTGFEYDINSILEEHNEATQKPTPSAPKVSEWDSHNPTDARKKTLALHEDLESKLETHNEGKSSGEQLFTWRSDDQGSEAKNKAYKEILDGVKSNHPHTSTPEIRGWNSKGVVAIKSRVGSVDSMKDFTNPGHKDSLTLSASRMVSGAKLIEGNVNLQNTLNKLVTNIKDFNEKYSVRNNTGVFSIVNLDNIRTPDGKNGLMHQEFRLGEDHGGTFTAQMMVTADSTLLLNSDELKQFANRSRRAGEFVNSILTSFGEQESTIEAISPANQTKAKALLTKIPASNGAVRNQGSEINHDQKTVSIYMDTVREARHPEEYGSEGRRASKLSDDYDAKLQRDVIAPLEKLGYRISMSAR